MDLHLHLSVAFRALDRKWGAAVDLDSSEECLPCLPAVIDRSTTTFSSEEFLRKRCRPKPYSRGVKREKEDGNSNDSFANISSSRIPTLSEADVSADDVCGTVANFVVEFGKRHCLEAKTGTALDCALREKLPVKKILKQLKSSAKSYIDRKAWKKVKC